MTSRAACGVSLPASSDDGTDSTLPAFRRFMLSPTKACGLARNSDTSIWSSETPWRCVRPAMRDSESPERTRYSSPLDGPDGAAGAVVAGVLMRTGGGGRDARGAAIGAGAAATGGGASEAGAGAGVITGAVAGGAACAWREPGGSNSIVYSRTRRPLDHVASTMTSMKGSSTARSLVTRSTLRPSARRAICTCVDGSTAL